MNTAELLPLGELADNVDNCAECGASIEVGAFCDVECLRAYGYEIRLWYEPKDGQK